MVHKAAADGCALGEAASGRRAGRQVVGCVKRTMKHLKRPEWRVSRALRWLWDDERWGQLEVLGRVVRPEAECVFRM